MQSAHFSVAVLLWHSDISLEDIIYHDRLVLTTCYYTVKRYYDSVSNGFLDFK